MNVRKLGTILVAAGTVGAVGGLVADGIQLSRDSSLLSRHGALDPARPACIVFFAGLAIVAAGAALMLFDAVLYEPGDGRAPKRRRFLQVAVPIIAVALAGGGAALAAASSPLGKANPTSATALIATKKPPAVTSTTAAAASDGVVVAGSATGKSPCEKAAPTPASPGEVGTGQGGSAISAAAAAAETHGERGLVVQQPLTESQRVSLEWQMAAARAVAEKYPTVASAEAAGYRLSTVYVPCIGAHYTNVSLVGRFDPAKPSELLYDGTRPDSKIVGLSYFVFHPGGAPAGFAGPNDHWHQHNSNGGLCFGRNGTVIGGEDTEREAVRGQRRAEAPADRRLDGARVGRAGLRVQLGRVLR